jgi:hypothetical protein
MAANHDKRRQILRMSWAKIKKNGLMQKANDAGIKKAFRRPEGFCNSFI